MVRQLNPEALSDKTNALALSFKKTIIGQPEAAEAFTNVLERYYSGFYDRTRPIASLLFLGPTGTGKTASVEAFVTGLFGSPTQMVKVDCAEFQHSHEIAKLIGSPPGYLGHRETHPAITNEKLKALKNETFPFTVLLFDEIEKASDALWNLLLGILDKGTLTLGTNEVVDLTSTVIVMTSNVGSKEMALKMGEGALGFQSPTSEDIAAGELKDIAREAAKSKFLPEFLNRLDEIVVFNTLTQSDLNEIFSLELEKLQVMVLAKGRARILVKVSPAAQRQILKDGYDKKYNARFLKREIEKRVSKPVSRIIASEQIIDQDTLVVDYEKGKFKYYGSF